MKKILLMSVILGITISCSSVDQGNNRGLGRQIDSSDLSGSGRDSDRDSDKVVKKRVKEIAYDSLKDYYSDWKMYGIDDNVITKNNNGILLKETLWPLDKDDLQKITENKEGDPLLVLSSHCYLRDFATASQMLLKYNRQYRKNPAFWNIMGNCYYLGGHLLKAKLYYNKALELDENYPSAISNLGVLYMREGRDQKALTAWLKVYKTTSFSLTPLANLARIYLKYAYIDKAEKLLESLIERAPEDVALKNDLATAYLMGGNIDKAYRLYKSIPLSKLKQRNIGVNYLLTLKLAGKQNEALALLENMAPFDEGNSSADKRFRDYYYKVEKFVKQ
ncbi:MAG: tetratricopeptide repeat protein [Oligoflexia bacterium]|nr:tetratricopeptide repeat protein [Oligoflexia bacterium]MBF0364214.1 tetratricopeptide repeat protein [Oligoflexia bacterium]